MITTVKSLCAELEKEAHAIPAERTEQLLKVSNYLTRKFSANEVPKIIVICTHNSRRSHLGQIWLAVGAEYYGLPTIQTFSGGTEATAFNPRAVDALRRVGFDVAADQPESTNPLYRISWAKDMVPTEAFSKKYGDDPNPKTDFAAILVCSEADAGCPVVFGCDFRLSLPYDDPKDFDGTEVEAAKYDERLRQIGREMLFCLRQVEH